MMRSRARELTLAMLVTAGPVGVIAQEPAAVPDSGAFVTMLGSDTLALERFVRTPRRVTADVVLRVPRTIRTRYTAELSPAGELVRLDATSIAPLSGAVARRDVITRVGDSLRIETTADGQTRARTVAAPPATLPFIDMIHWPYELALVRAQSSPRDSSTLPLLTGTRVSEFTLTRSSQDSVAIRHPFRGTMVTRIDSIGRLLGLDAGGTTRKLVVERRSWLAIEEPARGWARRDSAGRSLGALSGRAEARGRVGAATLTVDYGTPMKRGREIWGALVPFGEVWRTGANRATHLTTDRRIVLGAGSDTLSLSAGEYTLFSIPEPGGGVLIVSGQTGQNGNAYDPSRDLGRVPLIARPLPEPVETFTIAVEPSDGGGGALALQWDRTELVVPVRAP